MVATAQPAWLIAGTTGTLTSTTDGLHVTWYDPASVDELQPAEGAAPGRAYGTGEQIDWQEETITTEPAGATRTLLYYQHLARTLRHGANLYVTPESVRRQIDIIERARQQSGLL